MVTTPEPERTSRHLLRLYSSNSPDNFMAASPITASAISSESLPITSSAFLKRCSREAATSLFIFSKRVSRDPRDFAPSLNPSAFPRS